MWCRLEQRTLINMPHKTFWRSEFVKKERRKEEDRKKTHVNCSGAVRLNHDDDDDDGDDDDDDDDDDDNFTEEVC